MSHALAERFVVRIWKVPLPGVMHLLGDVLTPGGIRFFAAKIRFPLFKIGSVGEWLLLAFVGLTALFAAVPNRSFPGCLGGRQRPAARDLTLLALNLDRQQNNPHFDRI